MRKFLPLFFFIILSACNAESTSETKPTSQEEVRYEEPSSIEVKYDIPSLIGLNKQELNSQWGEPNCPPKNACVYGDMLEVYFVDGRAANFTLPPANNPSVYGFSVGEPSFTNTGIKRWKVNVSGAPVEVSSFEDHYVYVKTKEP